MMVQPIRLVSKPFMILDAQAKPRENQPEVVPYYWFSRKTYPAAGSRKLTFFDTVESDKSLSNMDLQAQFSSPQFVEVFSFHFDVLSRITNKVDADPPTGAIDDNERIRRSGRGIWTYKLSNKVLENQPLTILSPPGNPVGLLAAIDMVAAGGTPSSIQLPGWVGGYGSQDPIVTIPPTTGFAIFTEWPALAAITADTVVEFGLWTATHRKVV